MLDCSEVLDESMLAAGFEEAREAVAKGALLCMDPKKAETS